MKKMLRNLRGPATCVVALTLTHAAHAQTPRAPRPPAARRDTLRSDLDEVVVTASKVEESFLQSPVTVEKLTPRAIRLSPAPSFFDAIEGLKGVQVITPSLGFKVINARGFTNTTNVRFAQLVDGVDNQAPHIGAPVGNVLGPSDLDIQTVELVPGTAAALYGLNAINGLANFITKNPFNSQGFSLRQQTGINHLNDPNLRSVGSSVGLETIYSETSVRYAKVLIPDKLAFKVNGTYLRGYDWIANDQTDLNPNGNATTGLFGADNPAKDPTNSYGNESSDRSTLTLGGKQYQVARTGYNERDVVDYNLRTLKGDLALHYRFRPDVELAYTYRVAGFDNVYQRSNRFRLQGYRLQQHALTFTTPVVQARAYITEENTGQSYNLRSMAENIDRSYKPDTQWNADYTTAWNASYNAATTGGVAPTTAIIAQAHTAARTAADAGRLQPGTDAFNQKLAQLQDVNNWDVGAALRVRADLIHAEAQVNVAEAIRPGRQPAARQPRPAGGRRPPHLRGGARRQLLREPQPRQRPPQRQSDLLQNRRFCAGGRAVSGGEAAPHGHPAGRQERLLHPAPEPALHGRVFAHPAPELPPQLPERLPLPELVRGLLEREQRAGEAHRGPAGDERRRI